ITNLGSANRRRDLTMPELASALVNPQRPCTPRAMTVDAWIISRFRLWRTVFPVRHGTRSHATLNEISTVRAIFRERGVSATFLTLGWIAERHRPKQAVAPSVDSHRTS